MMFELTRVNGEVARVFFESPARYGSCRRDLAADQPVLIGRRAAGGAGQHLSACVHQAMAVGLMSECSLVAVSVPLPLLAGLLGVTGGTEQALGRAGQAEAGHRVSEQVHRAADRQRCPFLVAAAVAGKSVNIAL